MERLRSLFRLSQDRPERARRSCPCSCVWNSPVRSASVSRGRDGDTLAVEGKITHVALGFPTPTKHHRSGVQLLPCARAACAGCHGRRSDTRTRRSVCRYSSSEARVGAHAPTPSPPRRADISGSPPGAPVPPEGAGRGAADAGGGRQGERPLRRGAARCPGPGRARFRGAPPGGAARGTPLTRGRWSGRERSGGREVSAPARRTEEAGARERRRATVLLPPPKTCPSSPQPRGCHGPDHTPEALRGDAAVAGARGAAARLPPVSPPCSAGTAARRAGEAVRCVLPLIPSSADAIEFSFLAVPVLNQQTPKQGLSQWHCGHIAHGSWVTCCRS